MVCGMAGKIAFGLVAGIGIYIWCFFMGYPVRWGERRFVVCWMYGPYGYSRPKGWSHMTASGATLEARLHHLAWWMETRDDRVVLVNLDYFGSPLEGGVLARRLRRLVYRTARQKKVTTLPVPIQAWDRVASSSAQYNVVCRRRWECVFTKTGGGVTEYYLSGFDRNERPPLYFLTQLPCPVSSMSQARQVLKPASVLAAEAAGRRVYRQGDMFAIPTKITTREILAAGGKVAAGGSDVFPPPRRSLYGTAHTADYVAALPDGTMLARGKLHHVPWLIGEVRNPDHRPRRLKRNCWHVVAKNTTPMA